MQKLQLYISGTRVDLFKDESVSITQSIQNVRDISKIFTEFTQSFTVPASKTNNVLFRHYYNFDITVNSFDARNKVSSEIQLNYIPFKTGYIKLEGVEMKKNKAYAYKITFFGNTVNLKDVLGEDELSALTSLNSNNLPYNFSNIRNELTSTMGDIIVPLITHTRQLYYDSTPANYANGNLYWVDASSVNGVYWSDLKYAIRLDAILRAIESEYSLTFSNNFFVSSNTTWYNLYLWLHRKKGDVEPAQQVSMQFQQLTGFSAYNTASPQTSTSAGGINIPVPLVTDPSYITGFSLSFIAATANTDYTIRVFRNGSQVYQKQNVQNTQIITESDFTIQSGTYTVSVGSTSTVTFNSGDIRWQISGELGGETIAGSWTDEWRSNSSLSTSTTFDFVISEQIPKMKIIDFLSSIFKMFNLTAYVNEAGTIVVQKLDDYYNEGKGSVVGTTAWDINDYVDVEKSAVDIALPFKEIKFKYKGLGSYLAKQYEQLENSGWGSLNYSDGSDFSAPQNDYTIEVPFEHIQYQRLVNQTGSANTDIQWGWMVDDNKASYYGDPVIFYALYQTSATSISVKSDTTTYETTAYVIPSNSKALASGTSTENINFNAEINEYTGGSTFTGSLFENNYKTYIQNVFNSKQRLTKVKAYLPLKMIYNLKLNDKISLNNYTYRINSITTNLITGESSLELLNVT
jgi:hypothetical protein